MESTLPPLSFSAKDLLTRLVRSGATIRGNPTIPAEQLWLHNDRCLELPLNIEDVLELLQVGLIEYQSEKRFRVSAEGKKVAGREAVADSTRSATLY